MILSSQTQFDLRPDRSAFGADRTALLLDLAQDGAWAIHGGFAMGRAGARASYFGPCVTTDPDTLPEFLAWHGGRFPGAPIYWDIPGGNAAARHHAKRLGFTEQRHLARMVIGPGRRWHPETICALAGFEFG